MSLKHMGNHSSEWFEGVLRSRDDPEFNVIFKQQVPSPYNPLKLFTWKPFLPLQCFFLQMDLKHNFLDTY